MAESSEVGFDTNVHQLRRAEEHIANVERQRDKAIEATQQAHKVINDFLFNYYDGMRLDPLIRKFHQDKDQLDNAL